MILYLSTANDVVSEYADKRQDAYDLGCHSADLKRGLSSWKNQHVILGDRRYKRASIPLGHYHPITSVYPSVS
ncbi:hypothetical protein BDV25DRAFT_112723 [Aspergillus avenaceus]|uniref:Uncharacterized protein n=1 Tax=Aspergillus avenaceus TaxID=36643 RepID=A0A5N6TW98_ASPAV|nr:hypothetical protein BDV25DRAFT_112723 [Aspergillus avenaceus]